MVDDSLDVDECRICSFSEVAELGPLIAPCGCIGSMRYVHKHCLQRWRRLQDPVAASKCGVCGKPYDEAAIIGSTACGTILGTAALSAILRFPVLSTSVASSCLLKILSPRLQFNLGRAALIETLSPLPHFAYSGLLSFKQCVASEAINFLLGGIVCLSWPSVLDELFGLTKYSSRSFYQKVNGLFAFLMVDRARCFFQLQAAWACHTLISSPEAIRELKRAVEELASWASLAGEPLARVFKRLNREILMYKLFRLKLESKSIPDSILTRWDRLHAFSPDVVRTQLNLLEAQFEPPWLEFIFFRTNTDWENSKMALLTAILVGGTLAIYGHRDFTSWLRSSDVFDKQQRRQMACVFMNIFHLAYSAFHGAQVIRAIARDVALRVL